MSFSLWKRNQKDWKGIKRLLKWSFCGPVLVDAWCLNPSPRWWLKECTHKGEGTPTSAQESRCSAAWSPGPGSSPPTHLQRIQPSPPVGPRIQHRSFPGAQARMWPPAGAPWACHVVSLFAKWTWVGEGDTGNQTFSHSAVVTAHASISPLRNIPGWFPGRRGGKVKERVEKDWRMGRAPSARCQGWEATFCSPSCSLLQEALPNYFCPLLCSPSSEPLKIINTECPEE